MYISLNQAPQVLAIELNKRDSRDLKHFSRKVLASYGLLEGKWVVTKKEYFCTLCKGKLASMQVSLTGSGYRGEPRTHYCTNCGEKLIRCMHSQQAIQDEQDILEDIGRNEF